MRVITALSIHGAFILIVTVATSMQCGAQITGVPLYNRPLQISSFGFQCINNGTNATCGLNGRWPWSSSQPGTVRLWDSGTNWALLQQSSNSYDWKRLDTWLDMIAAHQPTTVIYTFGHVPCFVASVACTNAPGSHYWSASPPVDLTSNGSPTFNEFVKELTQHCSPNGNCVKTYIKYWELWNEANLTGFWTGTQEQLYEMFKPAVAIIRNNVPGAITTTPPVCGGNAPWMSSWLQLENKYGRLSDYYSFHLYLSTFTPEKKITIVAKMVDAKNTAGWTNTPWMNTETNFTHSGSYVCSPQYTATECRGQLVRWHVLQFAYQGGAGGAFHVGWFDWPSISTGGYDTFYFTMMKWLVGSRFTASCSSNNTVWTCPLLESNGHSALMVWNTAGTSNYTPAAEYVDYRSFNGTNGGATTSISSGEVTKIGVIPIMFEAAR